MRALGRGEVSAEELTRASLARIGEVDGKVKAFISVDAEGAVAKAKEVDRRRGAGEKVGRLAGLPVAVKDNICVKGKETTCASRMLAGFRPPYDATVVEKLDGADAVIVGKTNLDEFAMGSSTENSGYFATRNPWDLERVPGGSSGGSAAAVAAGMVPLALGSDTGGSIRLPASYCGVVGVKPTYGRVSRYGLVAFASSLDQIGVFARDVEGSALGLEAISGYDAKDSTSINEAVPGYAGELEKRPERLRLGVPREYLGEGVEPGVTEAVKRALEVYRANGAEVVEISLPHTEYAVATYYVIATAEASSNLARYDGVHYGHRSSGKLEMIEMYSRSRAEGFGAEVKRRIMLGTYALSAGYYDAYYVKALKVRRLIKQDFDEAFGKVDAVVCPVSPTTAFKVGEVVGDPLAMYLMDIFTIGVNLAGVGGMSIPCGFDERGLPVGLQIITPALEEGRMLRIGRVLEKEQCKTGNVKRPM